MFSPIDLLPCMIEEQFFASQIIEQIPTTLTMFRVFLINLRKRKGKIVMGDNAFLVINTCVQYLLILVLGSSSGLPLRCLCLTAITDLPSFPFSELATLHGYHRITVFHPGRFHTYPSSRSGPAFQESHFPKSPFVFAIGVVLARLFNFRLLVLTIEASLQFSDISRSGLAFQESHSRLQEFWQNIFWTWLVSCECANEVWMSLLYARRLYMIACRNYESEIAQTHTKLTSHTKN